MQKLNTHTLINKIKEAYISKISQIIIWANFFIDFPSAFFIMRVTSELDIETSRIIGIYYFSAIIGINFFILILGFILELICMNIKIKDNGTDEAQINNNTNAK